MEKTTIAFTEDRTTISFNEKEALSTAIKDHKNFFVSDIAGAQSVAVKWLEKTIESQGMRCRIYTRGRIATLSAGLIPNGVAQIVAASSGIAIAIHNLVTINPDYEICKGLTSDSLEVTYRKV